jgi:hypothetical protein
MFRMATPLLFAMLVFTGIITARAQDPQPQKKPEDVAASAQNNLEKAVQNPVASLISVPLQNNANFDLGPYNRTQDVLSIEPVIPVNISKNWMIITRIIQPLVWQPYPNQNTGGEYGLGDMNPTFFLSPRKPEKLIWGFGPAFVIPTATNQILGQGQFSIGPSLVLLTQPGHWTIGNLVNNVWSVVGESGRAPVNQMLDQYFVSYQIKKGWYVNSDPIITANWMASSGNVWTVPFGGGFGRVMKLGFQPINWQIGFYGNAVYPKGGSPWTMRMQLSFLFPKLSPEEKKMLMEMELKKMEQQQQSAPKKN